MNVGGVASECKKVGLWNNRVQFTLTNVDYRLMNSLRHVLLEEIPCLAFHTFRFAYNDTVLKHEQIMQILRMIPLASKAMQELKWSKDCDCDAKPCERCGVQFELDVENTSMNYMSVTTEHLRPTLRTADSSLSCPVIPLHKMEIVMLAPGQKLKLVAIAQIGIGREHGKWVCVPTMIYQGIPLLRSNMFHTLSLDTQREVVRNCSQHVFAFKQQLEIEDLLACTACDECTLAVNRADNSQKPNVELSDTDFLIKIETDGRHSIRDTLTLAFATLKSKISI